MKRSLTKGQRAKYDAQWRAHNKHLKQSGRHKEVISFDEYIDLVYGKKSSKGFRQLDTRRVPQVPVERDAQRYPSAGTVKGDGGCRKPNKQVYTGDEVIGIGTMHKSNQVPVTSTEQATDLANMRRN